MHPDAVQHLKPLRECSLSQKQVVLKTADDITRATGNEKRFFEAADMPLIFNAFPIYGGCTESRAKFSALQYINLEDLSNLGTLVGVRTVIISDTVDAPLTAISEALLVPTTAIIEMAQKADGGNLSQVNLLFRTEPHR